MRLELLISAVNQNADELVKKMNISSDAILINQCDKNEYDEIQLGEHKVLVYHFAERGVGLSRNNALLRATGDIVLFSDEDITYDAGYEEKVLTEFEKNPDADMIVFNVRVSEERRTYYNQKNGRVRLWNCGRYPTYSFAVRREKLHSKGITFSLLFGGGAKYSCGEDSLFIHDCIKSGMKVYKTTVELGEEALRESSWFNGYTEKFFYDRGALFQHLYGKLAWIMALRFIVLKKSFMCKEIPPRRAYELIREGIRKER